MLKQVEHFFEGLVSERSITVKERGTLISACIEKGMKPSVLKKGGQ